MQNDLSELCCLCGVSGFEFNILSYVREKFLSFCDRVDVDFMGNITGVFNESSDAQPMVLEAHYDEVGMLVTKIDENGFLRFTTVGGIDKSLLPACEVYIHSKGKVYFGVVSARQPHLKPYENDFNSELVIDAGFTPKEAAEKIEIGSFVSFASEPVFTDDGYVFSNSLDNRIGLLTLIKCGEKFKKSVFGGKVIFVASVQEELGLRGAYVACSSLKPKLAVAVDVTHGTNPKVSEDQGFNLKSGVSVGISPSLNSYLSDSLIAVAEKFGIPFTREVMPGCSGTDAWSIQISGQGIPTALLSVPVRYMHSPSETAALCDVHSCSELIFRFFAENYTSACKGEDVCLRN